MRSLATRNRFWFGMMIRVSTNFCSSSMPASASRMRRWPSKWKGLVTTPTVRMPASRAARAMTGRAPVPVPPPMPAVMNTMCAPSSCSRISSIASSAAARPTSGREPAPRPSVTPHAHLDAPFGLRLPHRLRVGVGDDEFDAFRARASIMLLTALPPAPPTPNTVMRGFISWLSGIFRLIVIGLPF